MSWFTDANCEAASQLEHAKMAYAVDLSYPSGHLYLTTWPGGLTIGGNVYAGVDKIASVSDIPDRSSLVAERWTYGISGVSLTEVPESEIDNAFGSSATEYEVWINGDTDAVIGTEINREGRMGRVRRRDGGAAPSIQQDCESRFVILEQADEWLWTTEHQDEFFTGDLGFDQARELDSVEIIWNGKRVNPGVVGAVANRVLNRG